MSSLTRLALLFILVPLVELALLLRVGQWAGLWPTLGLVAATGIFGAWLARREGARAFVRFRDQLATGRVPEAAALDGVCILIGGALLLTPGIVTDLWGLGLIAPPTRKWIQKRMRAAARRRLDEGVVQATIVSVSAPTRPDTQPQGPQPPETPGSGSGASGAD